MILGAAERPGQIGDSHLFDQVLRQIVHHPVRRPGNGACRGGHFQPRRDRRKGGLLLHPGRINYEALYENRICDAPAKTRAHLLYVVNTEMALKSAALFSRLSGEDPDAFAKKCGRP